LRRKAAIDAGDDAFRPHQPGVAEQPLGDQLGMLDDVARVGDDARQQHLSSGNFTLSQR